jgi:hypothetical protein
VKKSPVSEDAGLFAALKWPHPIGSCTFSAMPTLSADQTWMSEAENTVREVLGDLDDRMRVAVELGMILALKGSREGLVELVV